jgi:hypothetical protein
MQGPTFFIYVHKKLWYIFLLCWHNAQTYLQLSLWQWEAGNVYLVVLSIWKVNIAKKPIAFMELWICSGSVWQKGLVFQSFSWRMHSIICRNQIKCIQCSLLYESKLWLTTQCLSQKYFKFSEMLSKWSPGLIMLGLIQVCFWK